MSAEAVTTPRPILSSLGKFTAVGVAATAVHALVALVVAGWLTPLAANAVGFAVAVGVTYIGNYRFTFAASGGHGETVTRSPPRRRRTG